MNKAGTLQKCIVASWANLFLQHYCYEKYSNSNLKIKKRVGVRVGEREELRYINRPDRTAIRSMHMEIFVHFLRFRPTFVLVFPSTRASFCPVICLYIGLFGIPDDDPQTTIQSRCGLTCLVLGSCTCSALCIEPTQADSYFLLKKPARTPASVPTLRSLAFFSNVNLSQYRLKIRMSLFAFLRN